MNKKISFFPITIESLDEGGFFADCSILQGCHAEGDTYGEAIENIHCQKTWLLFFATRQG